MDLGIAGRTAIVCGSSKGLGRACAAALAAEGVTVVVNGRDPVRVHQTAGELTEEFGATVLPVVADVATSDGRAALLAAAGSPDILVNNSAGPPPGSFAELSEDDWNRAVSGTLMSALQLIQAVLPGMRRRGFGRIVNIVSAMVATPLPAMGLSSGPRAALVAVSKGLSLECAPDGVTINNLLPYRIDTDRQVFMARRDAEAQGISYEQARQQISATVAAGRLGRPEEFGAACAFLCSRPAGYISGTALHLDGGTHPALL